MLEVAITEIIAIVEALLPYIGASANAVSLVTTILGFLEKIMPELSTLSMTVLTAIQNIIAELKASGTPMTAAQVAQLDTFEQQTYTAFEAAAAAAGADPDPSP